MNLLKCEICGNIIELVEGNPTLLKCCGTELTKLPINSSEASGEKHLPVYEIMDKKIKVSVGEITHPMEENHNISWIALVSENKTIKKYLKTNNEPIVKFPYIKGSSIYAYCGVHGLFKTDVI